MSWLTVRGDSDCRDVSEKEQSQKFGYFVIWGAGNAFRLMVDGVRPPSLVQSFRQQRRDPARTFMTDTFREY